MILWNGGDVHEVSGFILSTAKANQNQQHILMGVTEMNATIKDLKDAGVAVLTSPFNSPI